MIPESQPLINSAATAATKVQVRDNAEAIARALKSVETLTGLLKTLEAAARGAGLRETSLACEDGRPDAVRIALSVLQSEANDALLQLRHASSDLRHGLGLLAEMSAEIGGAAQVVEERSHDSRG